MGTFESKNFTEGTRQTHFRWKSQHLPASHQDAGHASVSKWWWKYTKASIRPGFDGTFGHPPGRCLGILDPFPNDKKAWGTWRNLGSFAMIPILWQIRLLKFLGFRFRPSVLHRCCFGDFWAIHKTSQNKGKKENPSHTWSIWNWNFLPAALHVITTKCKFLCPKPVHFGDNSVSIRWSYFNRVQSIPPNIHPTWYIILRSFVRVTVGTQRPSPRWSFQNYCTQIGSAFPIFRVQKNTKKILEKPPPRYCELVFCLAIRSQKESFQSSSSKLTRLLFLFLYQPATKWEATDRKLNCSSVGKRIKHETRDTKNFARTNSKILWYCWLRFA